MNNHLIIDVETESVKRLIKKLMALETTIDVSDGGMYREDNTLSQVHLETTVSEQWMGAWLYSCCGRIEWIGVVTR